MDNLRDYLDEKYFKNEEILPANEIYDKYLLSFQDYQFYSEKKEDGSIKHVKIKANKDILLSFDEALELTKSIIEDVIYKDNQRLIKEDIAYCHSKILTMTIRERIKKFSKLSFLAKNNKEYTDDGKRVEVYFDTASYNIRMESELLNFMIKETFRRYFGIKVLYIQEVHSTFFDKDMNITIELL
jgi:hypothetical protein